MSAIYFIAGCLAGFGVGVLFVGWNQHWQWPGE